MHAHMAAGGGLIRFTAIVKRLEAQGAHELLKKLRDDVEKIGHTCKTHGKLADPIIGVDTVEKRLVIGCPWCSGGEVLKTWKAQEVES